jgi:hypothetical protein
MYIPITTAALVSLTAAMILLQIFWLRIPSRIRAFLIRASIVFVVIQCLSVATKWSTTSNRLNDAINWFAIAGFELMILLFSRLPPRWLTIPSAAVLLIPLFAASVMFPLSRIFQPAGNNNIPISDHLFYQVNPWANTGGGNAGIDILVYYHPSFAPFLRHKLQTIPFNDRECNTSAAFAVPGPTPKTILGRCPNWPSGPAEPLEKLMPLH